MPAMTGNQGSKVHQRTKTGKTKIVRKTGGCKVVSAVSTTEQQDTSVRRATLTHRERFVKRIGMKLKKIVSISLVQYLHLRKRGIIFRIEMTYLHFQENKDADLPS